MWRTQNRTVVRVQGDTLMKLLI